MSDDPAVLLDLKGLKCPLPVLRSRKRLSAMPANSLLELWTTDPLAVIDIAHMCHEDGNHLESSERRDSYHRFVIRKG